MKKVSLNKLPAIVILILMFDMMSCYSGGHKESSLSDNQNKTDIENQVKLDTVYQEGKSYVVPINESNLLIIKTGKILINGEEIENCVAAKEEIEVANYLLLMYRTHQNYMSRCSKKLEKSKVDEVLKKFERFGGRYTLEAEKNSKEINFWYSNLKGVEGKIKVELLKEKTTNSFTAANEENKNKYVITDIELK